MKRKKRIKPTWLLVKTEVFDRLVTHLVFSCREECNDHTYACCNGLKDSVIAKHFEVLYRLTRVAYSIGTGQATVFLPYDLSYNIYPEWLGILDVITLTQAISMSIKPEVIAEVRPLSDEELEAVDFLRQLHADATDLFSKGDYEGPERRLHGYVAYLS